MKDKPESRKKRQRRFYHTIRLFLITELGGVCQNCGATEDLEFDLKIPSDKRVKGKAFHHVTSSTNRISFYRKQYYLGNLGLLCSPCNSKKGDSIVFIDKNGEPTGNPF